ncbi:cupredoxin domain-containing protein [Neorhizobium alkalisoli]|uniref:cupredoxin domain-containing protein n=1 Tax=Neorhizobium alkalisoli TaxID=528178 RepID=UPI000CFA0404|nr:cupredoxin domain-containing protein [Neorhizobium alkalisoli]
MTALLNRRQLLAAGATLLAGNSPTRAHDGTVHVVIEKLAFLPADIEVKAGQIIEWTNKDAFAHTATVKSSWEVLIPPKEVATHVAAAGDSVDYYCRFHPNMKGKITVLV